MDVLDKKSGAVVIIDGEPVTSICGVVQYTCLMHGGKIHPYVHRVTSLTLIFLESVHTSVHYLVDVCYWECLLIETPLYALSEVFSSAWQFSMYTCACSNKDTYKKCSDNGQWHPCACIK